MSSYYFREKGGVFLINIKFHLAHSRLGHLTGLLSSPATTRLPSQFTIRVSRLTQAGYKVREVLEHRRDQRTTRTRLGQSKVEDGLTEALCCHKVSFMAPESWRSYTINLSTNQSTASIVLDQ